MVDVERDLLSSSDNHKNKSMINCLWKREEAGNESLLPSYKFIGVVVVDGDDDNVTPLSLGHVYFIDGMPINQNLKMSL